MHIGLLYLYLVDLIVIVQVSYEEARLYPTRPAGIPIPVTDAVGAKKKQIFNRYSLVSPQP